MVKFLLSMMGTCLFTCDFVVGEDALASFEMDEATGLLQTNKKSRDMPAILEEKKAQLVDAEAAAVAAHNDLQAALGPLAKVEAGTFDTMHTVGSKVADQYVTHTFIKPFSAVPVVPAVMSCVGDDPAEVRIFDITKNGFKATVAEPTGEDGPHKSEKVNFMAVVPGVHVVNGLMVAAGTATTNATVTARKFSKKNEGVGSAHMDFSIHTGCAYLAQFYR